ncbi:hypothetical protein M9458_027092, partial [Cirrhinus mrigala]
MEDTCASPADSTPNPMPGTVHAPTLSLPILKSPTLTDRWDTLNHSFLTFLLPEQLSNSEPVHSLHTRIYT